MEKIIGILDEQSVYAERLKNYINNDREIGRFAVHFSDVGELEEYCRKKQLVTLLLGEAMAEKTREKAVDTGDARIWILTEEKQEGDKSNRDKLFRYQKAGELLGKILLSAAAEQEPLGELYTVFSPESSVLADNYAKQLIGRLSEKGSILLLPWDPFLGYGRENGDGPSVSELLYLVRRDREQAEKMFYHLPKAGGAEYFSGPDFCTDLWRYSPEEMRQLIRYCRECGDYKYVIFLAGCFHEGVLAVMDQSISVCLVTSGKEDGVRRKNEFYRQMKYAGEQGILSRLTEVILSEENGKTEEKNGAAQKKTKG